MASTALSYHSRTVSGLLGPRVADAALFICNLNMPENMFGPTGLGGAHLLSTHFIMKGLSHYDIENSYTFSCSHLSRTLRTASFTPRKSPSGFGTHSSGPPFPKPGHPMVIYGCSPFAPHGPYTTGDHVQLAQRFARYILTTHAQPVLPHLYYPQFLNDSIYSERQQGLQWGLEELARCEALWVLETPPWSHGMWHEVIAAHRLHLPVTVITLATLHLPDYQHPDALKRALSPRSVITV